MRERPKRNNLPLAALLAVFGAIDFQNAKEGGRAEGSVATFVPVAHIWLLLAILGYLWPRLVARGPFLPLLAAFGCLCP